MSEYIVSDRFVSGQSSAEFPEALAEPTRPKSVLFLILYTVANMIMGVGNIALGTVLLPPRIAELAPDNHTMIFSLILAVGAVIAILANPLVGMLSDRTTSRLGRRRPWFIVGSVLTVLFMVLLSVAPNLFLLALAYMCLQVTINMLNVVLAAVLADQIPARQQATFSGLDGLGTFVGALLAQILVTRFFVGTQAGFLSLAVTITLMAGVFLLVLRDAVLPKAYVSSFHWKQLLHAFWLAPLRRRELVLNWLGRCLISLGYVTVVTFMFYYLQDVLQYSKLFPGQTTAQGERVFFAVNVASIILANVAGGILSDRLGQRRFFVIISGVIMAVGLLLYAFFPVWLVVLFATALLGTGFGLFQSVNMALTCRLLPASSDRGKDLGLMISSIYIPILLSPVLAGVALSLFHSYALLFCVLAVGAIGASIFMALIKGIR